MKNVKSTKKALLMSALSLLLCCSMLIGTTFAWFTDSVESSNNIIKSGRLDVEMYWADGTEAVPAADSSDWEDASTTAIFDYDKWEPGFAQVRHIKIANKGTLALKYQILIKANGTVSELSDVIDVYYTDPAAPVTNRSDLTADKKLGTLTQALAGMSTSASGDLKEGEETTITLALKMQETAGNEYQNLSIGTDFSVILLATQYTHEDDSFNNQYDANAQFDYYEGSVMPTALGAEVAAKNALGTKIANAKVPAAAINDPEAKVEIIVRPVDEDATVTVTAGQDAKSFDVTVTNIKEGNGADIEVELRVGTGLSGVALYHKGVLVPDAFYDGEYVRFTTTSFSPYTVVFDAEYVESVPSDTDVPQATVEIRDDLANEPHEWIDASGYLNAPAMAEGQTLAVAYQYSAPHNATNIADCKYKDWICDFYVRLDLADGKTVENNELPEGVLFLGGNYGDYTWVGFNNPVVPVGQEIPLLQTVANPWTYADIATSVGNFICGVNRVKDADTSILDGATFTVVLRLSDPEDPENSNKWIDINTQTYVFN